MSRRLRHPAAVWIDGKVWASRAEYDQAQKLAVEVAGPDVKLIDELVRHCETAQRRGRPDLLGFGGWKKEEQRQELVRDLCQRFGAASVIEEAPRTVPLTVAEIKMVEEIRHDIQYLAGYYLGSARDPMLDKADDLLHRLHFLVGRARATESLGGVAVFPAGTAGRTRGRAALEWSRT